METIGFIAAIRQEIHPFLRRVETPVVERLGEFTCFRFRLAGRACLLVRSGIGLVRAVSAACALVEAEKPSLLVSFGVAGAIHEGVRVADVVVARSAALLDAGVPDHILPCASLSAAALKAVTGVVRERGARLFSGTTISTPGPQATRVPAADIANPVMEMETHGIALVAARHGIPLVAIRAVSDSVEEPLPFRLEDFTDAACNLRVAAFIAHTIRHPRILPLLVRLQRNTRAAAENAAVAVLAALGVAAPIVRISW